MTEHAPGTDEIISFLRKRDYKLVEELGQGACGKTVLLYDEYVDEYYVCKKYVPYSDSYREELFAGFVKEIKLLHQLHHRNVVRVFHHYLYPEQYAGFILMEYVNGSTIDKHVAKNREGIGDIFLQTITGFSHLEQAGILHRDIRPTNIMVGENDTVKIIDLGFGKKIKMSKDFEKSISLNWAYEIPQELKEGRYDFTTEVYFVGKLFAHLIETNKISEFKHQAILEKMCANDPKFRIESFRDVEQAIGTNQFTEVGFSTEEINIYREFANEITFHVTKIEAATEYTDDPEIISAQLNDRYRNFMLEGNVPDPSSVLSCLIPGAYYYNHEPMSVTRVKNFIRLLKSCGEQKARIILANLHTRLDAIPRYKKEDEMPSEEIPF